MVGYLALNQADVGSTPTPATMHGQLMVGCLPLKQVTKVRPLPVQPAHEHGLQTGLQTLNRRFDSYHACQAR